MNTSGLVLGLGSALGLGSGFANYVFRMSHRSMCIILPAVSYDVAFLRNIFFNYL